jgi:hypothetical protein
MDLVAPLRQLQSHIDDMLPDAGMKRFRNEADFQAPPGLPGAGVNGRGSIPIRKIGARRNGKTQHIASHAREMAQRIEIAPSRFGSSLSLRPALSLTGAYDKHRTAGGPK